MTDRRSGGGRPPDRRLGVMFLGAGASKAAGLPLTEELLRHIWPRAFEADYARWETLRSAKQWKGDLEAAARVLYPDGGSPEFRPVVSEFFTLLEVMERVHGNRERLPLDPGELLKGLRAEIAQGLLATAAAQWRQASHLPHYGWFKAPQGRPAVVITSNWDTVIEQSAVRAGMNVRLAWPRTRSGNRRAELPPKTVVVLKLHGSVDWGRGDDPCVPDVAAAKSWEFERIDAPISSAGLRQHSRKGDELLVRHRSYDHPIARARGTRRFEEPHMATMAAGKEAFIADLGDIWDDAYWVLSRASWLDIVGYSFPPDDLELRTLLRVTTRGPGQAGLASDVEVSIVNPSPDTHERARSILGQDISSSFAGAQSWNMRRRRPTKGNGAV